MDACKLTVPTEVSFNTTAHLVWGDTAIDKPHPPYMVQVFLKRSKADQFGQSVVVFLGTTSNALCPVSAILAYVSRLDDNSGAFFLPVPVGVSSDEDPLCEASSVCSVGIPYQNHRFCISAATATAQVGLQDFTIQALSLHLACHHSLQTNE